MLKARVKPLLADSRDPRWWLSLTACLGCSTVVPDAQVSAAEVGGSLCIARSQIKAYVLLTWVILEAVTYI